MARTGMPPQLAYRSSGPVTTSGFTVTASSAARVGCFVSSRRSVSFGATPANVHSFSPRNVPRDTITVTVPSARSKPEDPSGPVMAVTVVAASAL
jgi:hypothetical protein